MIEFKKKSMDNRVLQGKLNKKEDELKLKYLEMINTSLTQAKEKNNGRIPQKMACNTVQSSLASQSWITRDVINFSFKKFEKNRQMQSIQASEKSVPSSLDNSLSDFHAQIAFILTHMYNNAKIEPTTDNL